MSAEVRRERIIGLLKASDLPLSGTELAKQCQISRQIIVQDIARLRASGYQILSTTKGYLLQSAPSNTCTLQVQHTDQQIEDELNTIVDLGGTVLDVSVQHDIYGTLTAPLYVSSRLQVQEFLLSLKKRQANPLKNLTADIHFHTIEADSEEILRLIEKSLQQKGYLLKRVEQ